MIRGGAERPVGFEALVLCSPWRIPETPAQAARLKDVDIHPLSDAADLILQKESPNLRRQLRWGSFGLGRVMEDMDVRGHTWRQTIVTAHATAIDADYYQLSNQDIDIQIAVATLHDIAEGRLGDTIYDKKQKDKRVQELAEAAEAMKIIDSVEDVGPELKERLKEAYLRVATSLEEEDVSRFLKAPVFLVGEVDWSRLRELFGLYERYGYLMTAYWEMLPIFWGTTHFSKDDFAAVGEWSREDLERADAEGFIIPDEFRRMGLNKNVLVNQWRYIPKAAEEGVPSARGLFDNPLTKDFVTQANQLLGLNLDLSFFSF